MEAEPVALKAEIMDLITTSMKSLAYLIVFTLMGLGLLDLLHQTFLRGFILLLLGMMILGALWFLPWRGFTKRETLIKPQRFPVFLELSNTDGAADAALEASHLGHKVTMNHDGGERDYLLQATFVVEPDGNLSVFSTTGVRWPHVQLVSAKPVGNRQELVVAVEEREVKMMVQPEAEDAKRLKAALRRTLKQRG